MITMRKMMMLLAPDRWDPAQPHPSAVSLTATTGTSMPSMRSCKLQILTFCSPPRHCDGPAETGASNEVSTTGSDSPEETGGVMAQVVPLAGALAAVVLAF